MPLHYDIGPQDGPAVVLSGLQRLATRKNHPKLDAVGMAAVTVGTPHAIYDLHADEIAKGGGLETAHATGFRYLVTRAGAPIAAAEVHLGGTGKPSLLANLNYGPYVAATAGAVADLARSEAAQPSVYEVRFLRFSAIYVGALWLKSVDGGADVIVPLAPAPRGLEVGKRYSAEDFLGAIRPLAQTRVQKADITKVP